MPAGEPTQLTGLGVPWAVLDGQGALHGQVARAIKEAIGAGRLGPGSRMPPSRSWAEELGLSRWVVTEAYEQLKAEGYLVAAVGSATRVSAEVSRHPVPVDPLPRTEKRLRALSPTVPDVRLFPRAAWRSALQHAVTHLDDDLLADPDPAGLPALRLTLASYVHRVRGLSVSADDVHVTAGTRAAMPRLMTVLARAGVRRLGVEDPGWPHARQIAALCGLVVVPLPVDTHGLQLDRLDEVDAVLITSTHQFPTGVPLSPARRLALAQWAVDGDHLVIEDDYDAEFRYDRTPVGALAALAPTHVLHVGSTSKTIGPGLHLGWVAAPAGLRSALVEARPGVGMAVPVLEQAALARMLDTGAYDKHLRRTRRTYHGRRRAMSSALTLHVPGQAMPSMDAGLHVIWLLPGANEADVLARGRDLGLSLVGLSECSVAPSPAGLLVGYAGVTEHEAGEVATRIGRAVLDSLY